jgi:hypothetical protein
MTNETYNYKQLIELAVLDAHGLLEPIESDLFNRSFLDAPVSIQDEIMRLQRDFAVDDTFLPTEVPSVNLRDKVLQSVAKAADQEAQRLAPLALIGARANAARNHIPVKPTYFWRTAALVLFGVTVVLGIIAVDSYQRANKMATVAMNIDATSTIVNAVGSEFKSFVDNPYCQVTRLERESGNNDGYLRVALNERFGGGYVLGLDLNDGEEIIIQGTTSGGELIELARITANSPIVGQSFAVDKSLVQGMKITAIDAKTGNRWV